MNESLPNSTKAVDSPQRRRERSKRAGIVLIIVMVVVVMISLAGFGFVASISNENRVVHLRGEQMQMQNALASAEEFLKQHLSQPPSTESSPVTPDEEQELMRALSWRMSLDQIHEFGSPSWHPTTTMVQAPNGTTDCCANPVDSISGMFWIGKPASRDSDVSH